MFDNGLDKKTIDAIRKSVDRYYNAIMQDINATVRIVIDGKEEKTYVSRIIDWDEQGISFHAPLVQGNYIKFIREKIYPFVFVTKQCIYMTQIQIVNFQKNKNGHFYYQALLRAPLEKNQQRKYFRLQWVQPFMYQIGDCEEWKKASILDITANNESESSRWKQASTLDISAGGIRMASEQRIEPNDQIHILISLLDTDIELYGIVLEEVEKNPANLYVYRVQFHNISRQTENLLMQLIMQRQREMLKRN